ncbi:MAG: hypothetical protein EAX96_16465 [Candidatus Lokiarchaeota archaeon]|nr:hypothetical protein [Candidatus Lokiarchaeota archaeon]
MSDIEKDPSVLKKIYVIQDFFNNINNDLKKIMEKNVNDLPNEIKYLDNRFKNVRTTFSEVLEFFGGLVDKPKESKPLSSLDLMTMFDVPDEMRKSLTALIRLGPSDVETITKRTQRKTELEKGFLLALHKMGYVEKFEKDGKEIYKATLGRKKSKIADQIWKALVKDSSEMMTYICKMELEKGELKKMDFEEIQKRVPHVKNDLELVKESLNQYISTLNSVLEKYKEVQKI